MSMILLHVERVCTDATVTLAFHGEDYFHVHVLLPDAPSNRSDSVFALTCAQKRQMATLVASHVIRKSVPCERSSKCP